MAVENKVPMLLLESPTWRVNKDWAARIADELNQDKKEGEEKVSYSDERLRELLHEGVNLIADVRAKYETEDTKIIIGTPLGPRDDGYFPKKLMNVEEATAYAATQIGHFKESQSDIITCYTMNYTAEAVGFALAAKAAEVPCSVCFTIEYHGKLQDGTTLKEAIDAVEEATGGYPKYYALNCVHPNHFDDVLKAAKENNEDWIKKFKSLIANGSSMTHEELEKATALDPGNPEELAKQVYSNHKEYGINILGGCCGTNVGHMTEIVKEFCRNNA